MADEIVTTSSSSPTSVAPIPVLPLPRHKTSMGVMTQVIQKEFLDLQVAEGRMLAECLHDETVLSLTASDNLNDPLFFWQIHSVAGRNPIFKLATLFYKRVFDDTDNDWFKGPFEVLSSKNYHIMSQAMMYIDCFGGGRLYGGGEKRVNLHHGDIMAKLLMTDRGAIQWSIYMKESLQEMQEELHAIDPRMRTALNTFLQYFMDKYGAQFGFDTASIVFGATYPPNMGHVVTASGCPLRQE